MNKKTELFNKKETGGRLKETRRAIKKTQKEIAGLCGLPTSMISEMESGNKKIHPAYLHLLASEFNVNLHWIFTGKGLMFMSPVELSWDFGRDNERIMEMIYLLENSTIMRFEILISYVMALENHRGQVKHLLEKIKKRKRGS